MALSGEPGLPKATMDDSGSNTQNRLYLMLSELQKIAKDVPRRFQQRLTLELLSGLANSMLDGTVFQIVDRLAEIQHVTEKQAFQMRQQLVAGHNADRQALLKQQKADLQAALERGESPARLEAAHQRDMQSLLHKQQAELTRCDMKVVTQLDQKVSEQQVILEKSGVPGFYVTNDPQEIRLQLYLLRFISEVSQMPALAQTDT
ncbi:protein DGCR6-like isoform X2 [Amphibalanus amphitrite]|uniref:protein DGCR6-like isoform X2 n=1 Tax=Amphibalanus amphitrite TaxID=1232801 RepID=UPI001C9108B5|nr:protein DGCR6-like isoform X2 [Amphibalanus amphitrite]